MKQPLQWYWLASILVAVGLTVAPDEPWESVAAAQSSSAVPAVSSAASQAADEATSDAERTRDEARQELERLRTAVGAKQAEAEGTLEKIVLAYEQDIAVSRRRADLEAQRKSAEEDLTAVRKGSWDLKERYELPELDNLEDEIAAVREHLAKSDAVVAAAKRAAADAERDWNDAESARRRAKDAASRSGESVAAAAAIYSSELESRLAKANLQFRNDSAAVEAFSREVEKLKLEDLLARREQIAPRTRYSRQALDEKLTTLKQSEVELGRRLEAAKSAADLYNRKWLAMRDRVESGADGSLAEQARAYQAGSELKQREIRVLGMLLERFPEMKDVLERRYAVYAGTATREEKIAWLKDIESSHEGLARDRAWVDAELAKTRSEAGDLKQKIERIDRHGDVLRWLAIDSRNVAETIEALEWVSAAYTIMWRVCERFAEDLGARSSLVDWREYLAAVRDAVREVWRYELTVVDDRAVTIGKVISSLLLFMLGIWISRRLSWQLGRRILPRLDVERGSASALQSLAFYTLIVFFGLVSLHLVSIPLTLFSVIGGALAIGFGFGGQNVMSNFISGIIMLIEQPVRVGDAIDVEGVTGWVERIGLRSTRLRTSNNSEMVIPNSTFLEKKVVNWTLTDPTLRFNVSVGVAYDSDVRRVKELLLQVAREHQLVLLTPEPRVLLVGFGESTLDFELWAWVRLSPRVDRRVVESDLRYRVEELFRAEGIVIPFPQRDLNWKGPGPAPVAAQRS